MVRSFRIARVSLLRPPPVPFRFVCSLISVSAASTKQIFDAKFSFSPAPFPPPHFLKGVGNTGLRRGEEPTKC